MLNSGATEDMNILERKLKQVETCGRTERLWAKYFRFAAVVKLVICSEHCGDLDLHLYGIILIVTCRYHGELQSSN